jgi:hypothetical protein
VPLLAYASSPNVLVLRDICIIPLPVLYSSVKGVLAPLRGNASCPCPSLLPTYWGLLGLVFYKYIPALCIQYKYVSGLKIGHNQVFPHFSDFMHYVKNLAQASPLLLQRHIKLNSLQTRSSNIDYRPTFGINKA